MSELNLVHSNSKITEHHNNECVEETVTGVLALGPGSGAESIKGRDPHLTWLCPPALRLT